MKLLIFCAFVYKYITQPQHNLFTWFFLLFCGSSFINPLHWFCFSSKYTISFSNSQRKCFLLNYCLGIGLLDCYCFWKGGGCRKNLAWSRNTLKNVSVVYSFLSDFVKCDRLRIFQQLLIYQNINRLWWEDILISLVNLTLFVI